MQTVACLLRSGRLQAYSCIRLCGIDLKWLRTDHVFVVVDKTAIWAKRFHCFRYSQHVMYDVFNVLWWYVLLLYALCVQRVDYSISILGQGQAFVYRPLRPTWFSVDNNGPFPTLINMLFVHCGPRWISGIKTCWIILVFMLRWSLVVVQQRILIYILWPAGHTPIQLPQSSTRGIEKISKLKILFAFFFVALAIRDDWIVKKMSFYLFYFYEKCVIDENKHDIKAWTYRPLLDDPCVSRSLSNNYLDALCFFWHLANPWIGF